MRVIFMGTPDFAVSALSALHSSPHEVAAVVTTPDKAQGRGLKVKPSAVKKFASMHGYPVLQPVNLKDEAFVNALRSYKAECFVVVAFKILPRSVFTLPPKGTVNVHASLLPAYRGAAPINWAIINGEKESGVTTILIDAKVDTGDILLQEKVAISQAMNAGDLHDILARKGAQLLIQSLDGMEKNSLKPQHQDNSKASKAPKLSAEIMALNFDKPVDTVYNHIRGLSPYPAAFCYLDNKKLKIFSASLTTAPATIFHAGEVIDVGRDYFEVACADYAIRIEEVQLEGKRRMTVAAFLNGFELKKGSVLKPHNR